MTARSRCALACATIVVAAAACRAGNSYSHGSSEKDRTDRAAEAYGDVYHQAAATNSTAGVDPGIHPNVLLGALTNPYANDHAAAVEGRRLYVAMNCVGCHGGRAGGGMGPSLRDSIWIYGSSDVQLYGTIAEGRSAGMPAWGPKLTQDEIWRLITYIRTLGTPDEPDPPPPAATPTDVSPPPGR